MQVILQRLPLSDYLTFRDVSHCWRAAIIDSKRWLPAAHQLPWLLTSFYDDMQTFYIKTDDDDGDYSFVSDRKICTSKHNHSDFCWRCVGAIEGWLIIDSLSRKSRNAKVPFFLNPVSGARVMLPLHPVDHPNHWMSFSLGKVVASSIPTSTKCYATCLHFRQQGRLAFCTPTDKSWTLIETQKNLEFRDIEILDGKLYAVGIPALEFVMVFDIHLDTHDGRLHTYTSQRLVTLHPNVKSIFDSLLVFRKCYLAKCSISKDLFMILYHNRRYHYNEELVRVLKLEHNVTTNPQWVEIADLGDRALFIGTLNNKFITCHDKTPERNCIYFVFSPGFNDGYTSGVFSLTDKSFKPIILPEHHRHYWAKHHSAWFTPNPC
ncbi:PREDICTED: uncharacterized protein LOC101303631 [Fragaria vesca subsp. vesca]|uniref:uncharacterized protein LOC101303631 n=1 Tax=Fragaria vesca subsp. vesca TaxID=101020 RepID=UPI0002C34918|nr:PREDICTED: uncharacterized protein LOC101303631 [Fragaria vesca subsp. vesca]